MEEIKTMHPGQAHIVSTLTKAINDHESKVPADQVAKLIEALEYCARPFEQKHLVKREFIGEAAKRMQIAKIALAEFKAEKAA